MLDELGVFSDCCRDAGRRVIVNTPPRLGSTSSAVAGVPNHSDNVPRFKCESTEPCIVYCPFHSLRHDLQWAAQTSSSLRAAFAVECNATLADDDRKAVHFLSAAFSLKTFKIKSVNVARGSGLHSN